MSSVQVILVTQNFAVVILWSEKRAGL